MINIGSLFIDSLDYVMIVDKDYNIVYNTRYEPAIGDEGGEKSKREHISKNFFEVYPGIKREESNIARCLETGEVIIRKHQNYQDYLGNAYTTNNVTLPLKRKGQIVGAVELTLDLGKGKDLHAAEERFERFTSRIKEAAEEITFDSVMTVNQEMKNNVEKAKMLAQVPTPTLICGETGTGKEIFAQAMINYSGVPKEKVVIQNCAAVPDTLIESILFGTVKGAYTDAENRDGLFTEADGGIIFLDEINSIPVPVQAKLLRVLQDGTFRPLGSNTDKKVRVKVIAAMNVDPVRAMDKGSFRKDLFYRLSGGLITLPPLRERKEDIRLFAEYYADYFADVYGKKIKGFADGLMEAFEEYPWEGNVRELMNTVEFMVTVAENSEILDESMLPAYMRKVMFERLSRVKSGSGIKYGAERSVELPGNVPGKERWYTSLSEEDMNNIEDYHEAMFTFERHLVERALKRVGGNKSQAAVSLGIPRQTLKYRMKILDIK